MAAVFFFLLFRFHQALYQPHYTQDEKSQPNDANKRFGGRAVLNLWFFGIRCRRWCWFLSHENSPFAYLGKSLQSLSIIPNMRPGVNPSMTLLMHVIRTWTSVHGTRLKTDLASDFRAERLLRLGRFMTLCGSLYLPPSKKQRRRQPRGKQPHCSFNLRYRWLF